MTVGSVCVTHRDFAGGVAKPADDRLDRLHIGLNAGGEGERGLAPTVTDLAFLDTRKLAEIQLNPERTAGSGHAGDIEFNYLAAARQGNNRGNKHKRQ